MIVKHNAHPTQTAERVAAKLSERGVAKVHPASKFAGADPPDEVADALGDLANGRAKNINEAGPLPIEGALIGDPKPLPGDPNDPLNYAYRSIKRENEAAQTLANKGYKVERIPEADGSLDYRINGHEYDCYAPFYAGGGDDYAKANAMWDYLYKDKLSKGKRRIVLNLDDHQAPLDVIKQTYRDYNTNPLDMDDCFVVKDGQIVTFWEFLR